MRNFCHICFTEIHPKVGWYYLISEERKETICRECQNKFQLIEGPSCQICHRPFNGLHARYICGNLCYDCLRWEEDPKWSGCLICNQSLYQYNDFLQETIARFKFRGDYILGEVFAEVFLKKLAFFQYDLLVPIPLSPERLKERGFNQAEALIHLAGLSADNSLKRTHSEKQSKKSRSQRIHVPQVFQISTSKIEERNIILIDDIYTTGSTIRHAAKVLIENGAKSVSSLTIARG